MKSYRHIAPPLRIYRGATCLQALGSELDRLGSTRAMLCCGATLSSSPQLLDPVREAMGHRLAVIYSDVKGSTPLASVEAGSAECRRVDADAIVALGGGSAMTTARAVSIVHGERRPVQELCTTRDNSGQLRSPKLLAPKLPVLAIPTTPTSATVKAGSAVLDPVSGKRLSLYDPKTRAQAVFIHPRLVASAPEKLVASAALSSLSLAVEGLMSLRGDPFADAMLMHSVRLFATGLGRLGSGWDNDVLADLVAASILAGQGTDQTGAGVGLSLGHAISTRYGLDTGVVDAILLPHVMRFNAEVSAVGIQKIASALGASAGLLEDNAAADVPEAIFQLLRSLSLPSRLRDVGVDRSALPEIASVALDDWFLQNNPRPIQDEADLRVLLDGAW